MIIKFKEKPEKNSGEIIVEKAGYRPLGVIIHSLEVAGEQLQMSRMSEFVYGGDEYEEEELNVADEEFVDTDVDSLLDLHGQLLLPESEESGDKSGEHRSEQIGETEELIKSSETEKD